MIFGKHARGDRADIELMHVDGRCAIRRFQLAKESEREENIRKDTTLVYLSAHNTKIHLIGAQQQTPFCVHEKNTTNFTASHRLSTQTKHHLIRYHSFTPLCGSLMRNDLPPFFTLLRCDLFALNRACKQTYHYAGHGKLCRKRIHHSEM